MSRYADFDKMIELIIKGMEHQGWKVNAISNAQIRKPVGSNKHNYELVFRFTGKRSKDKVNKR